MIHGTHQGLWHRHEGYMGHGMGARAEWLRRKANFNSDGFQVGLPVFTIHGNHDDPSGADNLSAVDVLSTCKLVNYFGKTVGLSAEAFWTAQVICLLPQVPLSSHS